MSQKPTSIQSHFRKPLSLLIPFLMPLAILASFSNAADTDPYARVIDSEVGQVSLEMCSRTLAPVSGVGPRIHLVSAIHIADPEFYDAMQALLDSYDLVLFEGVKPAGLDPIDPELDDQSKSDATGHRLSLLIDIADQFYASNNRLPESFDDLIKHADPRIASIVSSVRTDAWDEPIVVSRMDTQLDSQTTRIISFTSKGADRKVGGDGAATDISRTSRSYSEDSAPHPAPVGIQTQMADALRVEFQLDHMDTSKPNYINADIDINELQRQLSLQGEDNAMILQLIEGDSFQAKLIGFALKFVARSPQLSSMMKLVMMDMLALVESTDMLSQFDAIEEVILNGRNDIVIDYLNNALVDHPDVNDIAIFYGAGHMAGLEQTIVDMGYQVESNTWTPAMSVNIKETGMSSAQINMMRKMIKNSLEQQMK